MTTTYGLIVRDSTAVRGSGAIFGCIQTNWPVPPKPGDEWLCCRRPPGLPAAEVRRILLSGLNEEGIDERGVDIWIMMTAPRRLISHLVHEHGFRGET